MIPTTSMFPISFVRAHDKEQKQKQRQRKKQTHRRRGKRTEEQWNISEEETRRHDE